VAEAARLKARGVKFTRELDLSEPGTKFAFIEGPDGMSIELLQRD
jgi:lactoylglutathione lyase